MKNSFTLAICMFLLCSCTDGNTNAETQGVPAPDFRLEDSNHQRFYLNRHKGKIVVIAFWATWCNVCKTHLNALAKLNAEMKDKPVELVSIVVDPENRDTLAELLKTSINVNYPVLLDRKRQVMEKFKIKKIPTTIIIGPTNTIVLRKEGYHLSTIAQIRNRLDLLLENET
ncbi:hypothetical protein D1AOALGA4SA_6586 [Olavius algarvensis Delta 1 endosymbiont]|nr:hypothetical protein D1AOALGA4SA_6586 [Olavius algarvensis Delta 1 endosymbiont]